MNIRRRISNPTVRRRRAGGLAAGVVAVGLVGCQVTISSVGPDGTAGNSYSQSPAVGADREHVAFHSAATNLVDGDTNGVSDVFVRDAGAETTIRVSVASDGTQANGVSQFPSMSADGQTIAFVSAASNLVTGDTNGVRDVFVHDRVTGVTSRVSVASDGTQATGHSWAPSISSDGNVVTFTSSASNLVAGDTNGVSDVFVHDRVSGVTSRVSVASDGTEGDEASHSVALSADGGIVAFYSSASNLVDGDTNGVSDVFVHDRVTGVTGRVSVASDGSESGGSSTGRALSADGRFVVFDSLAMNLVDGDGNDSRDVFVHDRTDGTTTRVSVASDGTEANGSSSGGSISANGRHVAFDSGASNLVDDDTNATWDVFVHDRLEGVTTRNSVGPAGSQANGSSSGGRISADGGSVAFESWATNLVEDDGNDSIDVFVRRRR